ncbi:MAG: TIGR02266 family protein [Proteobacteria bacterium]|nr:TIGR02266 family protein [Pseudomonadota bacterium]
MQAIDWPPDALRNRKAGEQVRRALELLELGHSALQEEPALGGTASQVAEHARSARKGLVQYLQGRPAAGTGILAANQDLDRALALVTDRSRLSARQSQALEAVARAQALLYPVALAHNPQGSKPPRVLPRRKPSRSPPMPDHNRRKSPRVELNTQVTLEGPSNFYTGFAEDLSDGGLFVATYDLQPIGTKIELSFTLPSGHVVNVEGSVRWLRDPMDDNLDAPPGMGIMFSELAPEDAKAIQAFIEGRAPLFYDD